ncbi:MAG: ferrous iron transport protein B [Clostridia bacterium]|nr:ferrous iron transport protein B [Clostridia bacterium]
MSEKIINVALAGNPNVGKSTVFNELTGLKQHTGNWTGKTVDLASGIVKKGDTAYRFIDIPGTYSLKPHSKEEEVASEFLCFQRANEAIVVCDATSLERNLYLALQILETGIKTTLCINLLDEARKKGVMLNLPLLSRELGVNVVGTAARDGEGIDKLINSLSNKTYLTPLKIKYDASIEQAVEYIIPEIKKLKIDNVNEKWLALRLLEKEASVIRYLEKQYSVNQLEGLYEAVEKAVNFYNSNSQKEVEISEVISANLFKIAEAVAKKATVRKPNPEAIYKHDKIFTKRVSSYLVLMLILFVIFYITIIGANYPSQWLSVFFSFAESQLSTFFTNLGAPVFLKEMLINGGFRVLGWVVSVMLPPMAIFFPCFTFLEDLGLLPRIAYVLDNGFYKAGTCGKQALTTCMGYGCNCVGISGARIIDSKRERLIAILTNTLTPCNGRFPAIIKLISIFFVSFGEKSLLSALILAMIIVLSLALTLLLSNLLSKTLLKGEASHYILELPPYRKPQPSKILFESVVNRTLFVLGRAVAVAFPAGIVIWILANVSFGKEVNLLAVFCNLFEPMGKAMGMDGETLSAFFLGIPANEIVLPIALMSYLGAGELSGIESTKVISEILYSNGWNNITAVCYIIFSVVHFPCATALITVFKETKSIKWTALSFLIPTALGVVLCCAVNFISKIFI